MAGVKTKVIDTSSTNPTDFLASGAGKPVEAQAGEQPAPTPEPETKPPMPDVPMAGASEPPANRPGLETPVPTPEPDPFTLLKKWETQTTKRSLRGLNVHGGVVLRHSTVISDGRMVEAMVFVPKATVETLFTAEGQ